MLFPVNSDTVPVRQVTQAVGEHGPAGLPMEPGTHVHDVFSMLAERDEVLQLGCKALSIAEAGQPMHSCEPITSLYLPTGHAPHADPYPKFV